MPTIASEQYAHVYRVSRKSLTFCDRVNDSGLEIDNLNRAVYHMALITFVSMVRLLEPHRLPTESEPSWMERA